MVTDLKRTVLLVARIVEERFDELRFSLKRRLGLLDPFEMLWVGCDR